MDIVERLREGLHDLDFETMLNPLLDEAADEIERLREALKKLSEFDANPSGSGSAYGQCGEMVRIARSALQQKESE